MQTLVFIIKEICCIDHMVKCKVEQGYPSYQIVQRKNSNERILGISEKMNDVGLMRVDFKFSIYES